MAAVGIQRHVRSLRFDGRSVTLQREGGPTVARSQLHARPGPSGTASDRASSVNGVNSVGTPTSPALRRVRSSDEMLAGCGHLHYVAFDLLWLNGSGSPAPDAHPPEAPARAADP